MRNLILVERPGCEVGFSGLILEHPEHEWTLAAIRFQPNSLGGVDALKASAAWLKVGRYVCLECPPLPDDLLPIDFVAARLRDFGDFDCVYTHSHMSDKCGECITAVAAATVYRDVWVASGARSPDKVIVLTPEQHQQKLSLANCVYSTALRDRELGTQHLSSVEAYCKVSGTCVVRYFAEMARLPVYDPEDPWAHAMPAHQRIRSFMPAPLMDVSDPWYLSSSEYEEDRYQLELSALSRISWRSLVEIGACVGAFTLKLLKSFPDRRIIACEPYEPFARELEIRLCERARVLRVSAHEAIPEADVIFASSCLYYARPFPVRLLSIPAKYFVFSHCRRYQKRVVEPCMAAMHCTLLSEDELPARVETAYGLTDVKDGTIVQVWKARPSSE
jgi:hypothetical protein